MGLCRFCLEFVWIWLCPRNTCNFYYINFLGHSQILKNSRKNDRVPNFSKNDRVPNSQMDTPNDFLFFWVRPTLDMNDRFLWKLLINVFPLMLKNTETHLNVILETCRSISATCASQHSYLKEALKFENCNRKVNI